MSGLLDSLLHTPIAFGGGDLSQHDDSDMPNETPLPRHWTFHYMKRGGGMKVDNYEENIHAVASFGTVERFWRVYDHMSKPNDFRHPMDYHLFKSEAKPTWEDPSNQRGGKWLLRCRKGLASRYWEEVVLALIGGGVEGADGDDVDSRLAASAAADEGAGFRYAASVTGAVVSVRPTEDILCVWTTDGDDTEANNAVRDDMRRILQLPAAATLEYRRHQEPRGPPTAHHHHGHHGHHHHEGQGKERTFDKEGGERSHRQHHHHQTREPREGGSSAVGGGALESPRGDRPYSHHHSSHHPRQRYQADKEGADSSSAVVGGAERTSSTGSSTGYGSRTPGGGGSTFVPRSSSTPMSSTSLASPSSQASSSSSAFGAHPWEREGGGYKPKQQGTGGGGGYSRTAASSTAGTATTEGGLGPIGGATSPRTTGGFNKREADSELDWSRVRGSALQTSNSAPAGIVDTSSSSSNSLLSPASSSNATPTSSSGGASFWDRRRGQQGGGADGLPSPSSSQPSSASFSSAVGGGLGAVGTGRSLGGSNANSSGVTGGSSAVSSSEDRSSWHRGGGRKAYEGSSLPDAGGERL